MLKEQIGINSFSLDTLKTLELYSDRKGYNVAAQLLADSNDYPEIDVARFGKNKTVGILNDLVEKGYVKKTGNGRGTRYKI